MSLPLFQASRLLMVSIFDSLVVDLSHIFRPGRKWLVWGRILYAVSRPHYIDPVKSSSTFTRKIKITQTDAIRNYGIIDRTEVPAYSFSAHTQS
jgi:hypothetical protein